MKSQSNPSLQLTLATLAFAFSFAIWGMLAPMIKTFEKTMHLSQQQSWLLVATPVMLGSLGRLPIGMLADRLGARQVFGIILLLSSIPAYMLSITTDYHMMLVWALALGIAGTSFPVGVAFTTRWFRPELQGAALGIYGAGNIGQSIAVFGIPVLAKHIGGWQASYRVFALSVLIYGLVFLFSARNAPGKVQPKTVQEMLKVLATEKLSWLLSLFYFVTFGGFVALSIGLMKLLQELFHLDPADAGARVAGFVLVATVMRPIGGILSDRVGGVKVLSFVFPCAGLLALGMTQVSMVPFTIGALGVAAMAGLGNGAVFKLVPQYFPSNTGTVTGLVGAMGGAGGFFPPLVLGIIKTQTGGYALGFVLLALFCVVCYALNRTLLQGERWRKLQAAGA